MTWDGAILCGGASRRMGQDKALLEVDGEPMVLRVARALEQAGAARTVIVGGHRRMITAALEPLAAERPVEPGETAGAGSPDVTLGSAPSLAPGTRRDDLVPVVPDRVPGAGPLGGLLTALAAVDRALVLVVACDLVCPSPRAMAATVLALDTAPTADLATPISGRRPQWLHAAWRRRAEQPLRAQFDAGERAIHRAVARSGLEVVHVPGISPRAVADADTPADLPTHPGQSA